MPTGKMRGLTATADRRRAPRGSSLMACFGGTVPVSLKWEAKVMRISGDWKQPELF